MNKKIILSASALAVIGAGLLSTTSTFAQSSTDTTNPMSSLVQKISEKFNLDQADVQAVFDQEHQERHAQMEGKFDAKLSQYVTDGKITEAQKQLIIQKRAELKANLETNRDSMQNMTPAERHAAMESERQALQTWATENGIDIQYLMPHGPGGKGHHKMRGGMRDFQSTTQPTSTPTQ